MSYVHSNHAFKWGVEIRANRDATIFGTNRTGSYTFGGGTAYSPVLITSASGTHDIQPGDPLPDSLTGLLTATPYSYGVIAAADVTPTGDRFDEAAVRREAYNFYFQDTWKARPNLTVNYGLRYEVNSRIHEAGEPYFASQDSLTQAGTMFPTGTTMRSRSSYYNPQPPYDQDWNGWGRALSVDYAVTSHTVLHAGGAITTIVPNLWQDNFLTGGIPLATSLYANALPNVPLPFQNSVRAGQSSASLYHWRASFCSPTEIPTTCPEHASGPAAISG